MEDFKELKPLQNKQTEILKYINDFCEKKKTEWSIIFGIAFGAKRHVGPISCVDIITTSKQGILTQV